MITKPPEVTLRYRADRGRYYPDTVNDRTTIRSIAPQMPYSFPASELDGLLEVLSSWDIILCTINEKTSTNTRGFNQ